MLLAPLSILLYSGDFDRIHYALAMASAAAAMNKKVTLFVTMNACRAFLSDRSQRYALPLSSGVTGLADNAQALDDYYASHNIARFEILLEAVIDLKVEWIFCEMGLRALQIDSTQLDPRLPLSLGGLVSFHGKAEGGDVVMV